MSNLKTVLLAGLFALTTTSCIMLVGNAYAVKVGDQGVVNIHGVLSEQSCNSLDYVNFLNLESGDGLCDIWINTGNCQWVDECQPPCGVYDCLCPASVVQTHGPCGGYNGGFGLP